MTQAFRVAMPNEDVLRGAITKMILDSRYASPKIDTQANPPHAGIIFLNWTDTTAITDGVTKLLYYFPHGFNKMPAVIGNYNFDNGSNRFKGVLPFQNGAQGVLFIDADDVNINLKYFSTDVTNSPITPFTMQVKFYVMADHSYEN